MTRSSRVERRILSLLHGKETRTHLPHIHAHFLRHHLHHSNQILAHFVSVCGSLGRLAYARLVFSQSPNPNLTLFNSMIKAYSRSGPSQEPLHLFQLMKARGICPDEYTFAPLLKSCANLRGLRSGEAAHAMILANGLECYASIRVGIVELYAACERMDDAEKVFDEMLHRDAIIWNLMVCGFCKRGNVDKGLHLFRQMSQRNVVTWNTMISGLAQCGRYGEALELFREMLEHGFKPDEATVVTVLPICARLGAIDLGQWIRSYAESSRLFREVIRVGNALVDYYCKCGFLETAWQVFREMPRKNVISWNCMISGLAFNGEGELGVNLFDGMMSKGVKPNDASFVGVLSCCTHAGLVERGRKLFASMTANHGLQPKIEHYGCMVDLLGRSGCVDDVYNLISSMPIRPNAALWSSLLSACRTHGHKKLAECAVKELINLEPWNSGNYVLLSNIYADEGKWDEVEKVRVLMRETSVKKSPGASLVR